MFGKHSEGGHEAPKLWPEWPEDRSQDFRQVILDIGQRFPDFSVSAEGKANGYKLRILSKNRKGADLNTGNPAVSALLAELESKRFRISEIPVEIENDGHTWNEFDIADDKEN